MALNVENIYIIQSKVFLYFTSLLFSDDHGTSLSKSNLNISGSLLNLTRALGMHIQCHTEFIHMSGNLIVDNFF